MVLKCLCGNENYYLSTLYILIQNPAQVFDRLTWARDDCDPWLFLQDCVVAIVVNKYKMITILLNPNLEKHDFYEKNNSFWQ